MSEVSLDENTRTSSGLRELDRVLGGGLVQGSVILIGGDPGIGKSTLLLQTLAAIRQLKSLYVSGEATYDLATAVLDDPVGGQIAIEEFLGDHARFPVRVVGHRD